MQGIPGQMRPLLGIPQPGFSPFGVAPPGGMNRPPLLPPGSGRPSLPPNMMPSQPMPPPVSAPAPPEPVQEDEPPAKKAKTVEELLIPEGQFLASNSSSSTFSVALPSDKPEMNLNGQVISLTLALTDPVSVLKSKINEVIGLAPGKQKLSREGLFFKDQNTLAYYNIGDGTTVQLSLKERGGRKK
jgi:splicing factor 3A subunit 1